MPEKQVIEMVGWKTSAMFDRYNIIDERDVLVSGARLEHYHPNCRKKFVQQYTNRPNIDSE